MVSFTLRPLYPRGRSSRYPLDRRLDGLQSRSGKYGEVKIFSPSGLELRPIVRPARNHIKIDLGEIGWGGMAWTDLTQDRDQWTAAVNTAVNLRVP
jgi:hypothetical protein